MFNETRERYRQQRLEEGLDANDSGNSSAWRGTDAEAQELMVYHTAILRNKQLLFNYVKLREEKIKELRWTYRTLPQHVKGNLSPLELQYFKGYDQLLNKYMRSGRGGWGLDLTVDCNPPDDPYVNVKVLRDYGEVVFTSGKVCLPISQNSPQLLMQKIGPSPIFFIVIMHTESENMYTNSSDVNRTKFICPEVLLNHSWLLTNNVWLRKCLSFCHFSRFY